MFNIIKGSIYRSALIYHSADCCLALIPVISDFEITLNDIYLPVYKSLTDNFGSLSFWHGFTVASALMEQLLAPLLLASLQIGMVDVQCYF